MKVAVTLGTRPEIIKMAPVIRELQTRNADFFILHTGQHYSYNMDRVFFDQLMLPQPRHNLEVGSGSHAEQTAKILIGIENVLHEEKPDIVLIEGDTNSVLAAALAAAKLHIKIGHVEAGLRSYDRDMPEEINRILTDHCSDYLFAPTTKAKATLMGEGIPAEKIFTTGNTIVDAVYQHLDIANDKRNTLGPLNLQARAYFLVTLHRQENVDNRKRFTSILEGLNKVINYFGLPVIYPIHPHSKRKMDEFGLDPGDIRFIDPLDYLDFLRMESSARLILTDSGGVQEEACILRIPCITLRDNTERQETIKAGSNILAGASPEKILKCSEAMLGARNGWANPYGNGNAGHTIVKLVIEGRHG